MFRLAIAAAALLATAPALAHHGWSGYDATKLVTLEGTVQSMSYDNPHAMVGLRTADKTWRIILAPPSRMQRRGLPDGAIKADETVWVEGYVHREDPEEFRAERIIVNGESHELR